MGESTNPPDGSEPPELTEQLRPYRRYGDDELAVTLLAFQKHFGGAGISAPADAGPDYHCETCQKDVRGVSRPNGDVLVCPFCGNAPGTRTIDRGPQGTDE